MTLPYVSIKCLIRNRISYSINSHEDSLARACIQAKTFSHIMAGKDVVGQARTGTGKTLGFALPLIELLKKNPSKLRGRKPRAIVMLPTRELAIQVCMYAYMCVCKFILTSKG